MTKTAGVLITDGNVILMGHSTGNNFWDIPKGRVEEGETPLAACIRECEEETGLNISNKPLMFIGNFNYRKNKELYLFAWLVNDKPKIEDITCVSTFELNGKEYPELDQFKYVPIIEVEKYACANMFKILKSLFRKVLKDG